MDVGQDSPIIIQSDDEDDDDVLLIKEEKAPLCSEKKDEDDVIFVSEEHAPILKKGTSATQTGSSSDGQSSSSSDEEDVTYNATQLFPYTSEFSSVSAIDNIIRPLDLSSSPLTTLDGTISTPIITCVDLPGVGLSQGSTSNPDNQCLNGEKVPQDADLNLGKLQSVFDMGASKIDDLSSSSKSHSFIPLKLTDVQDTNLTNTLNTPVCKMDLDKGYFDLKGARTLHSSGALLSLPHIQNQLSTCNSDIDNSSRGFFLNIKDISVSSCAHQDKSLPLQEGDSCKPVSDLDSILPGMPGGLVRTSFSTDKNPSTCPESHSGVKRATRLSPAFAPSCFRNARDEKASTSKCDDSMQQSSMSDSGEKSVKKYSNTLLHFGFDKFSREDVDSLFLFLAPDVIDAKKRNVDSLKMQGTSHFDTQDFNSNDVQQKSKVVSDESHSGISNLMGLKQCVDDLLSSSDDTTPSTDSFSSVATVSDLLGKRDLMKPGESHHGQLTAVIPQSSSSHLGAPPNVHLSVQAALNSRGLKHSSCCSSREAHKRPLTAALISSCSHESDKLSSLTEDPCMDKKVKVVLGETKKTVINSDDSFLKGQSRQSSKCTRKHKHFRRLPDSEAESDPSFGSQNGGKPTKSHRSSHAGHYHRPCKTMHLCDVQEPISDGLDSTGNSPDISDDIRENRTGNVAISSNVLSLVKESSKVQYNAVQAIRKRYVLNRRLKIKKSVTASVNNSSSQYSNVLSNNPLDQDRAGHSKVDKEAVPNLTRNSQPNNIATSCGTSKAVKVGVKHKEKKNHYNEWLTEDWFQKHFDNSESKKLDEEPKAKWRVVTHDSPGKVKLKVVRDCFNTGSDRGSPVRKANKSMLKKSQGRPEPWEGGLKKALIKRHTSMVVPHNSTGKMPVKSFHRSMSDSNCFGAMVCVTCSKSSHGKKLSRCEIGHGVCVTCLEDQVKAILTGKVKQRNIKCPSSNCDKVITFDELKQTLPQFVVDILEEKLDKAYLDYITHWMFTDEKLKSRSEFATSETVAPPCPTISMKKYEEVYTPESRDPTEDLPSVWTQMERGAPIMVFEVVPDTEEYTALALQFHETLEFPRYEIVRIIRVQNPILWKYFALKRSEMVQENDGMDVAEIKLFHGTHRSTLEAIARKGFDWRLSGKHGTVFGCGSYFAKESRYSHGYTDRAGSGVSVRLGGTPSTMFRPIYSRGVGAPHGHLRPLPVYNLAQPTVTPLMGLPSSLLSQTHPPQPPPAHFHLPPPPPAHGQMSSLQVPAHNQTSGPQPIQHTSATTCLLPSGSTNLPSSNNGPLLVSSSANSPFHFNASQSSTLKSVRQAVLNTHGFLDSLLGVNSKCNSNCGGTRPTMGPLTSSVPSQLNGAPFVNTRSLFPSGSCSSNSNPWLTNIFNSGSAPEAGSSCKLSDSSSNNSVNSSCLYANKGSVNKANGKTEGSSETSLAGGRGSADLASVFCQDAKPDSHFMFVARVLVGRHTGGSSGLKRPPPLDQNNPFGKCYDSCVDNIFSPQVYVIFDSNQAYPEYVIEYTWSKDQEIKPSATTNWQKNLCHNKLAEKPLPQQMEHMFCQINLFFKQLV